MILWENKKEDLQCRVLRCTIEKFIFPTGIRIIITIIKAEKIIDLCSDLLQLCIIYKKHIFSIII